MIQELANDYVSYMKVDMNKELSPLVDNLEDLLTRLEEFESLITMVQANGSQCLKNLVPDVVMCIDNLQTLCDRVDSLDTFVQQIRHDLDAVESQMDVAEADIGCAEGKLKSFLKPLFFKKSDPSTRTVKSPAYKPPDIFNTSNFFQPDTEQ
ncbi:hypothetical protein R5R35_002980 [Gryllus longicercus]|uniref:Biogenesis of lysosome-related organelles complex 1 subunit 4 n=1 Tax=Gryllus longicercus TaxID=2509291 RepID=A0AAN9VVW2_9ORTH